MRKTFGKVILDRKKNIWQIVQAQPHVCIKLKAIFTKISKTAAPPFSIQNALDTSFDLLWFMDRYPMEISAEDLKELVAQKKRHLSREKKMEGIFFPDYVPAKYELNAGEVARDYQVRAADLHRVQKRLLLGDDIGLGKTVSGILTFLSPGTLPGVVVVQVHLANQWKREIERFTSLKVHIIKGTSPYELPKADIYIFKYSNLAGWSSLFHTGYFKSVVYDEAQELRRHESKKYQAATILSNSAEYSLGMTATPIFNFGGEIFNILNLLNPKCLGERDDFLREWATVRGKNAVIKDPKALGTYLRDNFLFLRRTRKEVGKELPPVNKIVHTVGYDEDEVRKAEDLARSLSMKVLTGPSYMERGKAALELDMLLRHQTGISKAREVAEYVKILLENNEPVILAGWHRDVYAIWLDCLKEYNPVLYTGSETPAQKERSKDAFINGETNLFIISLRSGIGLDGLQKRCSTVVIGELDWSPQVHNQVIGRADREGQIDQVTAIFLVSEYGSDAVISDLLGLKASQADAIIDPLGQVTVQMSDETRIKKLAESFLQKRGPQMEAA